MTALDSPREITSSTHCVNEGGGDFSGLLGMVTGRAGIKMDNVAVPYPAHTEDGMTIIFF